MKTITQRWILTIFTTCSAIVLLTTSSFAETPKSTTEESTGQMMYPQGMPGGMGPGYMRQGGMGPGYMGYGGMGPGYMRQHGMGYGGMGYGGMGMMGGGMGMMRALNLDKDQSAKLRGMMREERIARCKTMNEMLDVRDEMATEYDKPQPDAKVIGKLYSKMSEIQRHMIEQSVQMRNKMREMLNKDQKDTFDHMLQGGMMGGGMGYGGMGMMNMMGGGMMGSGGMMNMME
jgi:Spy/CpxP family protein refolding chaperone